MASKEQRTGIEQINDAVNSLDQQTQQNAMIASQTHDVALDTDTIAKLVVDDANSKNFIGKDTVVAKDMKKNHIKNPATIKPQEKTKNTLQTKTQNTIKPIVSSNKSDDEWASF
jgi:methyl-accepting chemotaxis protein